MAAAGTAAAARAPHAVSPTIRRYAASHERLVGILEQVVGAHLAEGLWDGSVKLMQSMAFIKPPGFPGQAFHQDELYIASRDRSLTAVWVPLEDVDRQSGTLWVVPGTHRMGYLFPIRSHDQHGEFEYDDVSFGFDASEEVPVELKAGDALFFNGYLVHRSAKNRSQGTRRVLTNHYLNAWSRMPMEVASHEVAAMADDRSVVPVSGIDRDAAEKGYDDAKLLGKFGIRVRGEDGRIRKVRVGDKE